MTKLEELQQQKRALEASLNELSATGGDASELQKKLRTINALIGLADPKSAW